MRPHRYRGRLFLLDFFEKPTTSSEVHAFGDKRFVLWIIFHAKILTMYTAMPI